MIMIIVGTQSMTDGTLLLHFTTYKAESEERILRCGIQRDVEKSKQG